MKTKFSTFSLIALFIFVSSGTSVSQSSCTDHHTHASAVATLPFIENLDQWHPTVLYRAGMGGMDQVFLEEKNFTYQFFDRASSELLHDLAYQQNGEEGAQHLVASHAYKVHFEGADVPVVYGVDRQPHSINFFKGNDPSAWKTDIAVYHKIRYDHLYKGIHLEAYSEGDAFKYDFMVEAGRDVSQIRMRYEGVDAIDLVKGVLVLSTSVETIHELQPYAWQLVDGKKQTVPCEYHLHNNIVTFHFPKGYDHLSDLVIDPVVMAATLSGTTSFKNFGHSATYDNSDNIYTSGISFGPGCFDFLLGFWRWHYQLSAKSDAHLYGGGNIYRDGGRIIPNCLQRI